MPHPTCPATPSPRAPAAALIDAVADQLVAAQRAEPDAGAALVRVRTIGDGIQLGFLPLPSGVHPADMLVGLVVPPPWTIAGVVASGTVHRPGTGGERVALAVLADRRGRRTHRVEPVAGPGWRSPDTPPDGRLVDLLLRSLGCPTPAAAAAPRHWWAALWLDGVVAEVARDPGVCRTFSDLARLHPLAPPEPPAGRRAPGATPDPEATWAELRLLASTPDAEGVPAGAAVRATLAARIDPATAAWMDDGCFARWLLGALPPLDDLLAATHALLPPALAAALRATVGGRRGEAG